VNATTSSNALTLLHGMAAEDSAHPSPTALLTRSMAAGDDDAFGRFHAAYAARLFRYVLVLMRGDEHAAAEVLQDTLIRVARHVREFEDEDVLWSWLTRLARTAAADHGRKGSRYLGFLHRFWQSTVATTPYDENPEEDRLATALNSALEKLPADDAALLRAKYHHQQSQRDLAAQHGISEEAVESRLRRARAVLRKLAFEILHRPTP
jgi:RNA polymerase sigma-70 factor, ECF subfamily